MAKLLRVALYNVLLIAGACHARFQPNDEQAMRAYINEPSNGLLKTALASPFRTSLQYLPPVYLQQVQGAKLSAGTSDETATFQLRIRASNEAMALPSLLRHEAPPEWSESQQRQALFYGFEQVCRLHLNNQVIKPLFATVEVTPQIQQEISVVIVFPLTSAELRQHAELKMVLLPTYFLKTSTSFIYNTNDLLAVYPLSSDNPL